MSLYTRSTVSRRCSPTLTMRRCRGQSMSGRTSVLRTGRHATCGSPGATSKMRQRNAALHSCAAVQTQLCEWGASRHHPRSCARYDFNYESVVPLYRKVYTRCSPAGAWRRPTNFAFFVSPVGRRRQVRDPRLQRRYRHDGPTPQFSSMTVSALSRPVAR